MRHFIALPLVLLASGALAQEEVSQFLSGPGNITFLAGGVALPFLLDGNEAKNHGWRTLEAIGLSVIASEGLKRVIRAPRPDSGSHNSFPSGHATAAFALAGMASQWHPKEAPFWYAGAAAIAYSRVDLNRHTWADVIGGAALGYSIARLESGRSSGWLVTPLVSHQGYGLMVSLRY